MRALPPTPRGSGSSTPTAPTCSTTLSPTSRRRSTATSLRQQGASDQQIAAKLHEFALTGDPTPANLFDTAGVYYRGALTLHALRLTIGDEAFFTTLKTYAETYKYGNATTADFIAVAEQVSGQQLDDFFHAWLFDPVVPPLPVKAE